ncbi:MAG: hypothetical protein KatS3mg077_0870 [Candidatus Binatia bacterium]|nr:MAG: hypothetical protein KatS3mg077_0870 [Candidatus Binatia bacterium]
MLSVLFTLAILAAIAGMAARRWQARRDQRQQPGATVERAVIVGRFDEIDDALEHYRCARCRAPVQRLGEFSRTVGERRFRVARVACPSCGTEERVHFDVTAAFH